MADRSTIVDPKKESFEHFAEGFIFEEYRFFLYHKYNDDCKETATSFRQVLRSKPSPPPPSSSRTNDDDEGRSGRRHLYLHQYADEPINAKILRSVAIHCGSNVTSICFSSMSLTDKMVEGILPHLSKLRYLQFNGVNIGSVAARAIAIFCHDTLESLRISGCRLITSESCGWLAGIIGHNSPCLRKLRALDVSSTEVDDRGLAFLSKGLGQLEHLDLGNCPQLTFVGKGIQKHLQEDGSFFSMAVLNLQGCKAVGDDGAVAIAQSMPNLKHLNLCGCVRITNASASAIGRGCTQLTTLGLEGALGITDAGLGMVCNRTKLDLLNITGCSVSRKSLVAVVLTLGYVRESSSFFGFVIRDSDAKVAALNVEEMSNTREEQNQAAHAIQVGWKGVRHSIHIMQSVRERHEQNAAMKIQACVLNRKSRKRFEDLGNIRVRAIGSVRIQKMFRGWLARRKMRNLVILYRILNANAKFIQAIYRGKFVRSRDKLVMPAIFALRARKLFEKRTNAVTIIQCFWRNVVAILRLDFLRKEFNLRRYSSTLLQSIVRKMIARRRLKMLQMYAEMYHYYCNKMATRIQCFVRQYAARRELDKCIHLAAEKYLIKHNSAKRIQSVYRGRLDFRIVRRKQLAWNKAAVEIQRIVRGKNVQRWGDMKMDAISRYVHKKADFEHAESLIIRRGYMQSLEAPREVDETPLKNTPDDDELLKYVFGQSFVKLRCLIFWHEIGLYKAGLIRRYNDRMQLWQIDYDGDDNEWIDLVRDHDRVMVMDENAGDWIPCNYCRPLPMTRYLEKRKTIEPSNSTWTPQCSREKISSESWYFSYLTRGLLDECYHTQSLEALHKLRNAHLVKFLTVSIAKVKYMQRREVCHGPLSEIEQFESLLREVEEFISMNLAE